MASKLGGIGAALLLAAALTGATAAAEDRPTAEDRERARTLLLDGRARLSAGDVAGAVRSFQAAHAIMGVPTTGLDLAKGLAAQGRLIEARAAALAVAQMPAAPGEPAAFLRARAAASPLAEELGRRIPALVIAVEGPPAAHARVTVDGTTVPAEALGLPWKVDPGEHVVAVVAPGFQAEQRTVRVKEVEARSITLTPAPAATSAPSAPGRAGSPRTAPAPAYASGDEGQGVPTWAWISGGAGLAALGFSAAFALDYVSVRETVTRDCPNGVCRRTGYDAASANALEARWDRDLGLSIGLGAAGLVGVGLAVSAFAFIASPPARPSDTGRAARSIAAVPWLSAEGAGATVRGAF